MIAESLPDDDRDEVISDGVMSHRASQCQWKPSVIYIDADACLVNGAAHYRERQSDDR